MMAAILNSAILDSAILHKKKIQTHSSNSTLMIAAQKHCLPHYSDHFVQKELHLIH